MVTKKTQTFREYPQILRNVEKMTKNMQQFLIQYPFFKIICMN